MQQLHSDPDSMENLQRMHDAEAIQSRCIPHVKTVLVVLASAGMVYDVDSLRQKILMAYSGAQVFFLTTAGKPVGSRVPAHVDLLIDLTSPGSRSPFLLPRRLRAISRYAVGRDAGLWRENVYDQIFYEKKDPATPRGCLERERYVQKKVLESVGVGFVPTGETHPDRGKSIALGLPAMARL